MSTTTITRRAALTGSLAAIGAAGAPATAVPAVAGPKATAEPVEDMLEYLPLEFRALAYLERIRLRQPVAVREAFIAKVEAANLLDADDLATLRWCVDLPA